MWCVPVPSQGPQVNWPVPRHEWHAEVILLLVLWPLPYESVIIIMYLKHENIRCRCHISSFRVNCCRNCSAHQFSCCIPASLFDSCVDLCCIALVHVDCLFGYGSLHLFFALLLLWSVDSLHSMWVMDGVQSNTYGINCLLLFHQCSIRCQKKLSNSSTTRHLFCKWWGKVIDIQQYLVLDPN